MSDMVPVGISSSRKNIMLAYLNPVKNNSLSCSRNKTIEFRIRNRGE
jgi:hypothetical protein